MVQDVQPEIGKVDLCGAKLDGRSAEQPTRVVHEAHREHRLRPFAQRRHDPEAFEEADGRPDQRGRTAVGPRRRGDVNGIEPGLGEGDGGTGACQPAADDPDFMTRWTQGRTPAVLRP